MIEVDSSISSDAPVIQTMYKRPVLREPFAKRAGPGKVTSCPIPMRPDDQAPMWSWSFRPIKDWAGYLNVQRMNGASKEELERLEVLHKRHWPVKEIHTEVKKYNTLKIIMKTKVDEQTGHVRVKVTENKFATMLHDMHMGKKISQKTWVEGWMYAGRSYKDILEGIVKLRSCKNDRCPLLEVKEKVPTQAPKKILVPVKKS